MYLIIVILTAFLIIILIPARKEDDGRKGRFILTHKIALYLYRLYSIVRNPNRDDYLSLRNTEDRITKNLKATSDGPSAKDLRKNYYVDKIELTLLIIYAGAVLATCIRISDTTTGLIRNGAILRKGRFQDQTEVGLITRLDGKDEQFSLTVQPVEVTKEEIWILESEFEENLEELILGDNNSMEEVAHDLLLREEYPGYPFEVSWRSDREEYISSKGVVNAADEKIFLQLNANIRYKEDSWDKSFQVVVLPKEYSERELLIRDIQRSLEEAEEESRLQSSWKLPESVDGIELTWSENRTDWSLIFFLLSIVTGVVIFFAADHDLNKSVEDRKKLMKQEYPRVVQLLTLYVGAGMTVRGALNRITVEYENDNPIYQEIKLTCKEMQGGVSEAEAYERLGHRVGVREYIQLGMLLNINLRRGSYDLVDRLTEEATKAQNDRLQNSRRAGEELSSKLLIPLMMYLGMVMVMIMIPAFSSI